MFQTVYIGNFEGCQDRLLNFNFPFLKTFLCYLTQLQTCDFVVLAPQILEFFFFLSLSSICSCIPSFIVQKIFANILLLNVLCLLILDKIKFIIIVVWQNFLAPSTAYYRAFCNL